MSEQEILCENAKEIFNFYEQGYKFYNKLEFGDDNEIAKSEWYACKEVNNENSLFVNSPIFFMKKRTDKQGRIVYNITDKETHILGAVINKEFLIQGQDVLIVTKNGDKKLVDDVYILG